MPLPTTPGKASGGAYTYTDCTSNCHMLVNMSAGQELELLPVIYKIHMSIYCFRFLICPFAKKVMFLFLKNIKDWNIEENHKIIAKNHYEKLEGFWTSTNGGVGLERQWLQKCWKYKSCS